MKSTFAGAFLLIFSTIAITLAAPAPSLVAATRDGLCGGASVDLTSLDSDDGADKDSCDDADPCEVENDDGSCKITASEQKVNNLVTFILNIFTTIIGVVAVIFIIIGGFKYITSGGDSSKVGSAKSTIIYALIGLVVVAFAQFLVRFVLAKLH